MCRNFGDTVLKPVVVSNDGVPVSSRKRRIKSSSSAIDASQSSRSGLWSGYIIYNMVMSVLFHKNKSVEESNEGGRR